jgi:hypothetical protein
VYFNRLSAALSVFIVMVYQVDALIRRRNNMLIKSTYLRVIITTLILSSSTSVFADEVKFRLAIVKDAIGVKDANVTDFNKNMSLCVAYTQTNNANKSEAACTAAIAGIKLLTGHAKKTKYLESLSYSNRGISRYLNKDFSGATDDLIAAVLIDSNPIAKGNLKLLRQHSLVVEPSNATELSD